MQPVRTHAGRVRCDGAVQGLLEVRPLHYEVRLRCGPILSLRLHRPRRGGDDQTPRVRNECNMHRPAQREQTSMKRQIDPCRCEDLATAVERNDIEMVRGF